jgi:hypothetical protein
LLLLVAGEVRVQQLLQVQPWQVVLVEQLQHLQEPQSFQEELVAQEGTGQAQPQVEREQEAVVLVLVQMASHQ